MHQKLVEHGRCFPKPWPKVQFDYTTLSLCENLEQNLHTTKKSGASKHSSQYKIANNWIHATNTNVSRQDQKTLQDVTDLHTIVKDSNMNLITCIPQTIFCVLGEESEGCSASFSSLLMKHREGELHSICTNPKFCGCAFKVLLKQANFIATSVTLRTVDLECHKPSLQSLHTIPWY